MHADDVLGGQPLTLGHHLVFENQLQETAAIAKIDKDQAAEIPTAPHPTHDLHPFAEVVAAEARAPGSVPRTCRHVSLRLTISVLVPDPDARTSRTHRRYSI